MDDSKKCTCGGDMKLECQESHEHGATCQYKCQACGMVEPAPAEPAAPAGEPPVGM